MFPRKYKSGDREKIVIARSFRVGKKTSTKVVSYLGYVDEILSSHPEVTDVMEWAKGEIKKLEAQGELEVIPNEIVIKTSKKARNPENIKRKNRNIGYLILSALYHRLEIDYFLNNRDKAKTSYNLNSIFKNLVFNRILVPDSKLSAWEDRDRYFEDTNFKLEHVYRALGRIAKLKGSLVEWLDQAIKTHYGRNKLLMYYDVTNYYFEIGNQDEEGGERKVCRRNGQSKEHRPLPIIQMGLFMDTDGIPASYELFSGNTHDCKTLAPTIMNQICHSSKTPIVTIADKGMMSGDNLRTILTQKQGYIISNSVRKADAAFKEYVLKEDDYTVWEDPNTIGEDGRCEPVFKLKSRIIPREIRVTVYDKDTNKAIGTTKVRINERQIVFWSRNYAIRTKLERAKIIKKAQKLINTKTDDAKLFKFGARSLIKKTPVNKDGKPIDVDSYVITLDEDKIDEAAELDGYYVICTNVIGTEDENVKAYFKAHPKKEAHFDRSGFFYINKQVEDSEIVNMYHGLWRIEETFRVTKSVLKTRPVYVWTEEHIEAHFLICFVALTILRLLQKETNWKYSAQKIQSLLEEATVDWLTENFWEKKNYDSDEFRELANAVHLNFGDDPIISTRGIQHLVGNAKKY